MFVVMEGLIANLRLKAQHRGYIFRLAQIQNIYGMFHCIETWLQKAIRARIVWIPWVSLRLCQVENFIRNTLAYAESVTSQLLTPKNKFNNFYLGHHNYYDVPKMMQSNCTKIIPSFLLFNNNGELHGFGQTTVGNLSSSSFEHPNGFAVKVGINFKFQFFLINPISNLWFVKLGLDPITPECMLNMAESPSSPGYSNIHFFFVDTPRDIQCAPINQTVAAGNLNYINPNSFAKQKHWGWCFFL